MAYALASPPARARSFPIAVLFAREVAARLSSPWAFLLASAACLIATLYGSGFQKAFETETVLVTGNPLAMLNAIVAAFLAVVLGIRLAAGFAWEREHGTLEVLLLSSAGPRSIVAAKFAAELALLLLLIALYAAFLLVAQPLGAGVVQPSDAAALAVDVVMVLPAMALGLLISCCCSSVRLAVLAYLVVLALFLAFEAILSMLQYAPPQDLSLAMLYLRAVMEQADGAIGLVSPGAPMADLVRSAAGEMLIRPATIAWSAAVALVTVALAGEVARFRGAA
jgi:ABC-type transport system involved in multi-copper enzyme maturation permease subunit